MSEFLGERFTHAVVYGASWLGVFTMGATVSGCATPAHAPGLEDPTPNAQEIYGTRTFWQESWTAQYRNPVTGEIRTIEYGNSTEFNPGSTTCPSYFPVEGPEQWELVPNSCAGFSLVPVQQ